MLLFCCVKQSAAQVVISPAAGDDTTRLVQILKGNSLREKMVDTTSYQTIAGDVKLRESLTVFTCDSAAINKSTNIMEAFGNIHINQQDSIHTYSQYLKYIGKERQAYLKKNVRLTDKKGTLYTDELEYNLTTNIANYKKGGRVVNGKTTLTSEEGTYYADTKDVYFKKNVHLVDPKYNITTDSLLYNTQSQVVTFITLTHIASKDGTDIYTSTGTYDLKNGTAFFGNNTVFKDSSGRVYTAQNVALDEKTKTAQLEGNAVIKDSVNGYTITGGQIFVKQNDGSFLATRKPVLIFKGEGNDSTYISADTLFSGIIKRDSTGKKQLLKTDTLKQTTVVNTDSLKTIMKDSVVIKLPVIIADSTKKDTSIKKDSLVISLIKDSLPPAINDSSIVVTKKTDSLNIAVKKMEQANDIALKKNSVVINKSDPRFKMDTGEPATEDTTKQEPVVKDADQLQKDTTINISKDTVIRYFQAFHHVRIFSDSIQAVCDSLFYTSEDSVFRMYTEPLVFSNKSQIAGDTIFLYTKNKKAHRVFVFDKGIIVNSLGNNMFNQVGGRTLNGYFKDGELDYMRVKGSPAESVFYPQDDDSAYTGMNRCKGDVIDVYFEAKTVNKVKFVNDVDGALYPMNQIPEGEKRLTQFIWQDVRRPKNKLELFE
jgi:lipopolysaccharide export system protein LptA